MSTSFEVGIEVINLMARVKELEAQVEALTPKPVVTSRWANIFHSSGGHKSRDSADSAAGAWRVGVVRTDKITHPGGRVEYRLEVEK